MKKVIVSQRVDIIPERGERRDALDQRLTDWLLAAGYLPVPMPNLFVAQRAEAQPSWLEGIGASAVLLSGGNDIGACPERDASERGLLQWAASGGIPVLGICRGMQMLGVHGRGELVRVAGHAGTRHAVQGEIARAAVNSYHDYALAACPAEYEVLACADDGVIEAMRHRTLSWEGWMWHPEREAQPQAEDLRRLHTLFGV